MAIERYRLGCPFWSFEPWNGSLYTSDARPSDRLEQYARVFNTVEGNTTFYSVPNAATAQRWRDAVPAHFRFCFKLPRALTHDGMLVGVERELLAFLRALEPLRDVLGPLLVQLPPAFGPGQLRDLDRFLATLPGEIEWAVEVRHRAFLDDESLAGLCDEVIGAHGGDRVVMDTRALRSGDPDHPEVRAALHKKPDLPVRPNAIGPRPFVRFVGHPDPTTNVPYLDDWAARVASWLDEGHEPYFFVHTASNLQTPDQARALHARLASAAVGELPAFPGEGGERRDGQLALL